MPGRAPRFPLRPWRRFARGARLLACLWLAGAGAPVLAQEITSARYSEPTTRYAHGVLGDAVEWSALVLRLSDNRRVTLRLPDTRVFEDLAPRVIAPTTGDPLVMVVESDLRLGARLALYDATGLHAATPFIGRSNRWLAPVGAALYDGKTVIAYVDRPHLAKILRFWRLDDGQLTHLADAPGLTNHRIGWDFIPGGVRDCGQGPEWITADAGWQNVMATRLDGPSPMSTPIGLYTGPDSLNAALSCP